MGGLYVGCPSSPCLKSISYIPSAKRCFICVHGSVQDLEIYRIISSSAHIISWRHNWESCSRLSIKCTPPRLVPISSSPSPLSAKLCSMCVNRSVQDLEIYCIISRPVPISKAVGIFGRGVVGCPSSAHLQLCCLPTLLDHLCLLNFVP